MILEEANLKLVFNCQLWTKQSQKQNQTLYSIDSKLIQEINLVDKLFDGEEFAYLTLGQLDQLAMEIFEKLGLNSSVKEFKEFFVANLLNQTADLIKNENEMKVDDFLYHLSPYGLNKPGLTTSDLRKMCLENSVSISSTDNTSIEINLSILDSDPNCVKFISIFSNETIASLKKLSTINNNKSLEEKLLDLNENKQNELKWDLVFVENSKVEEIESENNGSNETSPSYFETKLVPKSVVGISRLLKSNFLIKTRLHIEKVIDYEEGFDVSLGNFTLYTKKKDLIRDFRLANAEINRLKSELSGKKDEIESLRSSLKSTCEVS
jgi:hypothetical protein